jgi:PBP1b-binding outer membrane lipoprotein LpoB
MMKKTLSALAMIAGAALLATGCSQPPTDALNAARAALETARSSEAMDYAPESLQAAESAVDAMEAELKVQNEAFALTRSYDKTAELATAATTAAEKAATDASAGREMTMNEASARFEAVKTSLAETSEMIAKAPRGKGTRADIEAMKMDVAGVEAGLVDFESAFAAGRYKEALAKADAANETLDRIKADIEAAIGIRSAASAR